MAERIHDVVIVGAGPAGISAAIALAKAEVPVVVIEAGVFPGAENWSGAVYFGETLAHPELLGEDGLRQAAWERPVTQRGFYLYDGRSLQGLTYRNPDTFRHCYTVLRPTFDRYLAEIARGHGATILTETTVEGLLRDAAGRVTGVQTDRGPVNARVVFLAEGDASHLVSKEGYERVRDSAPHFLQGIKEVIELDPADIEDRFGLDSGDGAACEILLRNGNLYNRPANLNMGGFLYTNRASISLGLVMPLDNLSREFSGDHNRLMEWFKALPDIQRFTGGGQSVAYGTKIIRGGGLREIPQLIDHGLAIGGAASGIGVDFPYPNFTGPATAMGLGFARAVQQIRAADGRFTAEALEEHYLEPVKATHYFRNVAFLEDWPRYIETTRVFFSRFVDLKCGSMYIASHPDLHAGQKLWQLAKHVREAVPLKHLAGFFRDLRRQQKALGLKLRFWGTHPAPQTTATGQVVLEFRVDGEPRTPTLWPLSRIWHRAPAVLERAADLVYRNDDTPLPTKLNAAISAARRELNIADYFSVALFYLALIPLLPIQWICELVKLVATRPSPEQFFAGFFQKNKAAIRERTRLDPDSVTINQSIDEKLALVRYLSEDVSHIKVHRPEHFEDRRTLADSPLWHVCPANVYQQTTDDLGQVQVVVNHENCIKCETCWRGVPNDVDWTRQRAQRLVYSSPTPANAQVLELVNSVPCSVFSPPAAGSVARRDVQESEGQPGPHPSPAAPRPPEHRTPNTEHLTRFCAEVYRPPRYLDTGRRRRLLSLLEKAASGNGDHPLLVRALAHARRNKFFWAEADVRQYLSQLPPPEDQPSTAETREPSALRLHTRIGELFDHQAIKALEHGASLSDEQLGFLQMLADAATLPRSLILRELGRVDPALAVLVSGLATAQVNARPDLADVPWIGLDTARRHAAEFPIESQPRLEDVAADLNAIVLGAADTLLERTRQHAVNRIQFPGLFKDEDGQDGIAKFGAVKRLLGQMEYHHYVLQALFGKDDGRASRNAAVPALTKLLVTRAFGPDEGSLAYNAGQVLGGTAYSEDDIFSKFFRDSVVLPRLLFDNAALLRGLGPDAEQQLAAFSRETVRARAGDHPTELEQELVALAAGQAQPPPHESSTSFAALGALILEHGYPEQPLANPPTFSYRAELDKPNPYDYGDYLLNPLDPTAWRYVPEMLHADPDLRAYHEELQHHFISRYRDRTFDGRPYYRLVEHLHQVPLEDVQDMIQRGFTRMYIPAAYGGEDRLKAWYYILCPLSMRYADPAYALTIMAHSSIGTTPILLGLQQDIPRARQDLEAFLANPAQVDDRKSDIEHLLQMLSSPQAMRVKGAFMKLADRVKQDLGSKPMLRAIASKFLKHFMDAGRAGLRADIATFRTELEACLPALDLVRPGAEQVVAELERRTAAHELFLRLISAGQISAFALTEPSAGSDSGGLQTRAVLKRAAVQTADDGTKSFMVGDEQKILLDAATVDVARIEYRDDGRYYDGKRFDDLAQVRRENGAEYYEYYELNGAKMWITNGHVAGVFCLYALTPEGPTGFMVDRHSDGLVVGKDEEKMGQRGSPTNELGLTSVRVPRENIIGIEGRGQVNALETLNVGRTGLAISAAAMTAKIIEQTRQFVAEHQLDEDDSVQALVGQMTAEHFAAESVAYELVGRFDHHDTRSVRTESAIGKYFASEVLHRVISAAESIYGIDGASHLHELEKHRRDARVLTIYEGTNEVQRFLVLRDLVDRVLPRAADRLENEPPADPLEAAKYGLLRATKRAVDAFGAQVWQNAGFQPTMFRLVEIAGLIKAIDAARWRTAWLDRNAADGLHLQVMREASTRFTAQAQAEIDRLHAAFDHELGLLKQGLYPPVVRTASLALQEPEPEAAPVASETPVHQVDRPLNVVVVAELVPCFSPIPQMQHGALLETSYDFSPASWTALHQAAEIPDATVTVVTVAPRVALEPLRQALARGATATLLLETEALVTDPHYTGRLVMDQFGLQDTAVDLVLCGDAVLAAVLAGNLGSDACSHVRRFTIQHDTCEIRLEEPAGTLTRQLPLTLALEPGDVGPAASIDDLLAASARSLALVRARDVATVPVVAPSFEPVPAPPAAAETAAATPVTAAALVRDLAGIGRDGDTELPATFTGKIETVANGELPLWDAAVYLTDGEQADGLATAAAVAAELERPLQVVVIGNQDENQMRQVAARFPVDNVWFVTSPRLAATTPNGLLAALQQLWKDRLPDLVAAGTWADEVLARFARTFPRVQAVYRVTDVQPRDGGVDLITPAWDGKVCRRQPILALDAHPLIMTATGDAAVTPRQPGRVAHLALTGLAYDPAADDLAGLIAAAARETTATSIADARFIIDVGYAVRDQEQFDRVIMPLKRRLEEIGVGQVMLGGTRKVVEELKLLKPDQQIGQTGIAVDPNIIIAIGVSGAPQHIDYIGEHATIIAFNKDAEAPLMTLNQRRARPKVIPLVGDLYDLVPEFTAAL